MKEVVVLGNAPSRLEIDIESIKVPTIGCNAIYRDFSPTYLTAIDDNMIKEIVDNHSMWGSKFIIRKGSHHTTRLLKLGKEVYYVDGENIYLQGSGGLALAYAAENFDIVYMVGMDSQAGFRKDTNIYVGTKNYSPPYNHINYNKFIESHKRIMKQYCTTTFIHVIDNTPDWNYNLENYTRINTNTFKKLDLFI